MCKKKELGEGITGQVYMVVNKRGQEKAMKTINLHRINKAQIKELRLEVALLKTLDHPNIVRLLEVFEDSHHAMLVMDLCNGGNLASKGARNRLRTERAVASVVYQLFLAVKYIHEKNIIHRDIKLENVMLVSDDVRSLHVQLIDFGLSSLQSSTSSWGPWNRRKRLLDTICGTTFYMAPEVLKGHYGEECDIWSLGVLTYLLVSGKPPFSGDNERAISRKIKSVAVEFSDPIWKRMTPHAQNLVENLLVKEPEKRWKADQALQSPWFDKYRQEISDNADGATLEAEIVQSLTKFVEYGRMKRMAMLVIAHHSSVRELTKLKSTFVALDKDNSGSITLNELRNLLAKYNMSDEEAAKVFEGVDVDDSGEIQLTEFLAATMEATCKIDRERMADAFDHIAQGKEYITTSSLETLLGKIDKNQLKEMIASLDENHDGKISKDEFLALVDEKQKDDLAKFVDSDNNLFSAFREESEEDRS